MADLGFEEAAAIATNFKALMTAHISSARADDSQGFAVEPAEEGYTIRLLHPYGGGAAQSAAALGAMVCVVGDLKCKKSLSQKPYITSTMYDATDGATKSGATLIHFARFEDFTACMDAVAEAVGQKRIFSSPSWGHYTMNRDRGEIKNWNVAGER